MVSRHTPRQLREDRGAPRKRRQAAIARGGGHHGVGGPRIRLCLDSCG
jgi:hypothetical protein